MPETPGEKICSFGPKEIKEGELIGNIPGSEIGQDPSIIIKFVVSYYSLKESQPN